MVAFCFLIKNLNCYILSVFLCITIHVFIIVLGILFNVVSFSEGLNFTGNYLNWPAFLDRLRFIGTGSTGNLFFELV
jgi:maltodextrin utilization protein YvdJ